MSEQESRNLVISNEVTKQIGAALSHLFKLLHDLQTGEGILRAEPISHCWTYSEIAVCIKFGTFRAVFWSNSEISEKSWFDSDFS